MIYIVVPTYNRREICLNFIKMLQKQSYQDYKLVLVDHGKDKVGISLNDKIHIIESDVNGWARAVNVGLRFILQDSKHDDDTVLIINDDVSLNNDYLACCVEASNERPNAVLGTCCINSATGKAMRVSIKVSKNRAKNIYYYQGLSLDKIQEDYIESDLLTGKGTLIPILILKDIGIYAEEQLPHYKADHELVWRAKKKGYPIFAVKRMYLYTASGQLESGADKSFFENLSFMFTDMRSTMNVKDLKNYSKLAYTGFYRYYYFFINLLRYLIFGCLSALRTSITHKSTMHK